VLNAFDSFAGRCAFLWLLIPKSRSKNRADKVRLIGPNPNRLPDLPHKNYDTFSERFNSTDFSADNHSRSTIMDWLVIGAVVLGAYLVLNLLSSERITRAHQINTALAAAAIEKARSAAEVPVAIASELQLPAMNGAGKPKR
jgi:hypothetical protein